VPPVIRVENLGKKYTIQHQTGGGGGYRRLSEDLVEAIKRPFCKAKPHANGCPKNEDFWALRNVSFEVQQGEVLGIIGRNGAGKSTLLKILSRITEPTEGRVRLKGRVASLLEVGTGFHPELTGRENVYLNGAILGMSRAEIRRKFDEIVAFAEVEKFLDTPVKRYSSGMYVRLAFAVAAHLEPEILIVDEVLAVGDVEFQRKCLGKMEQVATGGRTVLFVSHNLAAIEDLCQAVHVIKNGNLLYTGTPRDAVKKYSEETMQIATRPTVRFDSASAIPLRMTSATILSNGVPTTAIGTGHPLTIRIEFASDTPILEPKIGFTVCSAEGARILDSNNRHVVAQRYDAPVNSGAIVCDFGAVPFCTRRYVVSLYFGDRAHDTHVVMDALNFDVVPSHNGACPNGTPPSHFNLWWPVRYNLSA
jgi:lipopolysaccharide transport system ATP-binding protein